MKDLTEKQEAFCQAYIANGGNAHWAAVEAGFAHPQVDGSRLLAKPHVGARIARLVSMNITSKLGELVERTFEIARDPEVPARDRLTALFWLMDRGGLTRDYHRSAPVVAVQVNVDMEARVSADEAIRDIERIRAARGVGGAGA